MNKKHTPLKRVTSRRVNFAFTVLCGLSISGTPQAAPQGGQVSAGSGSIQASGNITQINQNSQQLVIDWDSFNVGLNESVNFLQPNSSAAVLNRIYDQNPSQIFGNINANGRVFLSNPNGMIFGANSQVNVGSLFATTLGINNDAFMSGRYNFSAVSDGGAIVNHGLLNAATGGSVSLVADAVDNQGEIIAHYGYVNLASGRTAAIDFDGDGFIHFEIDGEVLDNATGKTTGVNNSGIIRADGGEVLLTARHAQDVFERAINNDGLIEAGRMLNEGGVIRLVGTGGDVVHSGVINVSGLDSDSTGGEVQILGDRVGLFDAAVVDASGSSGGGTVLVGGDFQGNNSAIPNASQTLVSRDSRIIADAQQSGDGGRVIIWADGYTRFLGDISATGGALAGNGGFVEVSGKQQLGFDGQVDTSANNGAVGQLLLDPTNIVVDSPSNPSGVAITDVDNFSDNSTCTDCTISAVTLVAANADITLQATNNITFSEDLTLNADNNLVAEAENNIIIDAGITVATQGTGGITLTADADNNGSGNATMNTGSALQTAGGDVAINASGNIGLAGIDAGAGSVAITTGAGDIISNSSSVSAGTLNLSAVNGDIGTSTKQINTTVTTLSADTSTGGGDISVTETDTINLAMINAGTGEINITATDIKAATDTNGNNISALTATPLTLVASAGGIGASDNKINTTTGAMSLTTGGTAAAGDIYIVESNSLNTSDITLNTLTGDITPANNIQTVDITADSLNLNADFGDANDHLLLTASTGGISGNSTLSSNDLTLTADTAGQAVGSSGTPVNTAVSGNLTASASNGTGGVYLSNTGALSIAGINAGIGNVELTATGAITESIANTTVDVTAASLSILDAAGVGAVTSNGALDLAVDSLSIAQSTPGAIYLTEADNIGLGVIDGSGQTVYLSAAGNITSNSSAINVTDLTLITTGNGSAIGATGAANTINTTVTGSLTATASTGNGGIYLSNTGALSIASVNAGTGDVGLTATGAIVDSSLDTGVDVSGAAISLDGAGIGLGTTVADALNISGSTLAATSTSGAIYLTEADNIGLGVIDGSGQTVYLSAAGNITNSGSDIDATNLMLIATAGGIGVASNVINTTTTGILSLTTGGVGAAGDIYVVENNSLSTSNINLNTASNDTQTVDISAAEIILDAAFGNAEDHLLLTASTGSISGSARLTSNNLTLTADAAGQAIGSSGTAISTSINGNFNASANNGAGGIYLANVGTLAVANVDAGVGDVGLTATDVMTIGMGTASLSSIGSQRYTAPTINLYASLFTSNSAIALNGDVRLFNPVSLDTNTGGGDIVITGGVDSDDSSVDGLSIRAGTGNVDLLGGIGQIANLYGLDVTTNGTLLLTGNITTNASDISLSASQISLADTMIGLSTGNGPGNISLSGNVDSVSSGSTQLTLQAGSSVTGGGDVDLSNAVVGSLISFNNLYAEGSNLLLNDVTTNYSQVYVGPTTISGDATFAVTSTDANSDIRFLSSVTGSSTNNLSITASSNLGRIVISNGINNVNNLSISGETVTFGAPASIIASDSINLTLGGASSILYLDAFGAEGLSNNTDLLSISTLGSIDVDGVTINSALTLSATGGSSSQIVFSADSEFTGNLTVLADDGIKVNARIATTSTGADINLNSDANNTAETNDNILFAAADISSGGSLIMSATNGGIELQGGTTTATGTTVLNIPNGGLDISGISVDGQSDPSLIYILDIVTNNDVRLGDIGQNNLIDSLSVTTANNNVYLYGDISTRRGGGVDLGSDITSVILADDVSIDTTTGNGSVSLTALEGAYSLNINSGNGGISLTAIGQNTALTALTVTNQGTTALTGNITTSAIGGVDFSGARDIDITGDISLTARNGGTINLAGGTVDGDAGLVLVSSGTTRVGGALNLINGELDLRNASNIVVDNDFTLTSTSATLGGSITTSSGVGSVDLSGAGAIVLNNNLLLDTSASDAAIDISGVDITGNSSLSLVSGAGDITLNNMTDLTSISISGSGLTTLAGNLTTTGTGGVDLGSASNILLGTNVSIDTTTNSGRIDLTGGGIEGPNSLTITTNEGAILLGDMGQSVALSALTINSTGVTTFDNAVISTQGSGINLTAATDVNITGDVVFNSSSGSGAVYLDGGAVDGAGGLTVNVNRGDLFLGAVGQDVPLAYLTLSGDGLNQVAGNISTLGNVDFSAANIDSIDPAIDLLINAGSGDISLAEVGATVPFLSLTLITSGNVNLSDNITTQGTGIDFTGAGSVILSDGSDITIDTSQADDGAILLNSGLSIDGNGSLNLLANLGDIELGDIGQTTAITALTTSSNGATTLAGAVTSTGDINISTGSIAQNGNITSTAGSLAIVSTADIVMAETAMSTTSNQPVNYTSTTGDIYVAQIDAGNGAVTLDAPQGNVYSSLGDNINLALSQPNITASTATINSGGAIGRSSASGITIDATSSIQLTFGADIAYINNVQGVPVQSSGRVIDVLADRKAMAAVGHSGGLEADALAQTAGDFAILPQEQSLFLIAGPNNQFAAQYDDAEVISIINPDVPTLLHTKDAWIFKRPEEKDEKDKRRGASWF
ncbi:Large exoproteins involved in heme utilization or adhesion [hydrothermal vent metagenome]|uniref:Large exoproteins involved in heme utilization or adhesion n=1 Tax=hydrothermal vent metagenome TaxID=652676 RepID=A0A3B1B3T2_9ZZZZ